MDQTDGLAHPVLSIELCKHAVEVVVPIGRDRRCPLFENEKNFLSSTFCGIGFGPLKAGAFWIDADQVRQVIAKLEVPRLSALVPLEVSQA